MADIPTLPDVESIRENVSCCLSYDENGGDLLAVIASIETMRRRQDRTIVGISGYAGSGKSTLARALVASVDRSARIRRDDFLDPSRSHRRSADWDGVERLRLREEVIDPFRGGQPGNFRRFDWSTRTLAAAEPLPKVDVLIVDGIGLFHPELRGAFDLAVWVGLHPELAAERGRNRDRKMGRDHDTLWDDIWIPNDRDFMASFNPREFADLVFDSDNTRASS